MMIIVLIISQQPRLFTKRDMHLSMPPSTLTTPFALLFIPMLLMAGKDIKGLMSGSFFKRKQSAIDENKTGKNQPHTGISIPSRRLSENNNP